MVGYTGYNGIYTEWHGKKNKILLSLNNEKIPLGMAEIIEMTLSGAICNKNNMDNDYYDTGDAIAYYRHKIKIIPNSFHLQSITPQDKLNDGGIELSEREYDNIQGEEYVLADIDKYILRNLTKKRAKENPILKSLIRNDDLLEEYIECVYENRIKRLIKRQVGIKVSIERKPSYIPRLKMWRIGGLEKATMPYLRGDLPFEEDGKILAVNKNLRPLIIFPPPFQSNL